MKCLLIIAHGSRKQTSNDEVRVLTERIADKTTQQYDKVRCAFLELALPSMPDTIDQCITEGAREIIILPYFLAAGRHVVKDIPEQVTTVKQFNPDIKIYIAPHLGSMSEIADLMAMQARITAELINLEG